MFKKLFIVGLMLAMVVGFTGMVSAKECHNCPSLAIVGNVGGGGQAQGWGGADFNFGPLSAWTSGHYQVGGTANAIGVLSIGTHGIAVNGNVYSQGFTSGKGKTSSQAWVNDIDMKENGSFKNYVERKNGCSDCGFTSTYKSGSYKSTTKGTNFGAVAGGELKGPGTYQSQAGFNYTKVKW